MARVLVIEDDAAINEVVATRLSRDGHAVTQAFSGSEARLLLGAADEKNGGFDVVVCDLMLPGATGEELVGLIRSRGSETPVVVISARTTAADRVDLLRLGADDYLSKPFDLDELAARVEVQLRHRGTPAPGGRTLRWRRWELDPEARTLAVAPRRGGRAGRRRLAHQNRVQHPRGARPPAEPRVLEVGALRAGLGRALRRRRLHGCRARLKHSLQAPRDRHGRLHQDRLGHGLQARLRRRGGA